MVYAILLSNDYYLANTFVPNNNLIVVIIMRVITRGQTFLSRKKEKMNDQIPIKMVLQVYFTNCKFCNLNFYAIAYSQYLSI